jgi:dTDP-4-dehydrorhamnose reductase
MKVAILGSTGMLGSMMRRYLSEQPGYELICPSRASLNSEAPFLVYRLSDILQCSDYAINCIGVIKPKIDEQDCYSVERAVQINALFPYRLAEAAVTTRCKILQIATDCVYSGTGQSAGVHDELSPHDPLDVYGKTKSLGEVVSPNVHHLRCSVIGPEGVGRPRDSLLEWFLGQPQGAQVKGFTNHCWNGITTLAFAKICHGVMQQGIVPQPLQHIVPRNRIAKADLLSHFRYFYGRPDIVIDRVDASVAVNRTLTTCSPDRNEELWKAAGYPRPPFTHELVEELAAYK